MVLHEASVPPPPASCTLTLVYITCANWLVVWVPPMRVWQQNGSNTLLSSAIQHGGVNKRHVTDVRCTLSQRVPPLPPPTNVPPSWRLKKKSRDDCHPPSLTLLVRLTSPQPRHARKRKWMKNDSPYTITKTKYEDKVIHSYVYDKKKQLST